MAQDVEKLCTNLVTLITSFKEPDPALLAFSVPPTSSSSPYVGPRTHRRNTVSSVVLLPDSPANRPLLAIETLARTLLPLIAAHSSSKYQDLHQEVLGVLSRLDECKGRAWNHQRNVAMETVSQVDAAPFVDTGE